MSYERTAAAVEAGVYLKDIVGVEVGGGRGKEPTLILEDEEPKATNLTKLPTLRSAFMKEVMT
jgi:hypothetical protein